MRFRSIKYENTLYVVALILAVALRFIRLGVLPLSDTFSVGGSAAILLDVPQDWLLLVSGLIAVPLIVIRDRHARVAAVG